MNLKSETLEQRARTVASLLSFFGIFIAEVMSAASEAETGEIQALLQTDIKPSQKPAKVCAGQRHPLSPGNLDTEDAAFMQSAPQTGPGMFARRLLQLQAQLESMDNVHESCQND